MYYADMLYFVALFGGLVVGALVILAVVLLVWVYRILATLKDIRRLLAASQTDQLAEHRQE